MPLSRAVGPVTVVALDDGEGLFFQPREQAFPQVTPELWRRADERDPDAVTADGRWLLRFRCFAVRSESGITLVDTGIGPADSPAASWAPVPGRLPQELAAAGIDPADVHTVVLTHLHTDHVGWAVTLSQPGPQGGSSVGTPYFPNASYLLQRAEADAVDDLNPALRERLLAPLAAADQLRLMDGDAQITAGVKVVATPGHTPGHQSVLIEYGDERVLVTGDLLVHAVQLVAPETPYRLEVDPEAARESRMNLLSRGTTLATPHLTEPFIQV
jgi:glyoxylase-like metal-dependent hydrolase (beta-lactamase superfamily II)